MTNALPKILFENLSSAPHSSSSIATAIRSSFLRADQSWFDRVKPVYDVGFTNPIKVGACAVAVALSDSHIIVGSVGDCKCILSSGNDVIDLNIQRNANEQSEQDRLRKLHPGEDDVVKCKRSWQEEVPVTSESPSKWIPWKTKTNASASTAQFITRYSGCYVKGRLQPTKSFGDFHLKSAQVEFDPERNRPFLDPSTPRSFPYIDADPDISITERNRGDDKFLIAATDGLWDQFSSREAAGIVEAALIAGLTPEQAAQELVEAALMRAATNHKMTLGELKLLPPGNSRRSLHDDISVCIIEL
jgi:pyruvate dehydrogenase phosphatase